MITLSMIRKEPKGVSNMNVYFDNSATTKPSPEVLRSMHEVAERFYGNPSSLHHLGIESENLIKKAREVIANSLKVDHSEIYFTSGGTESNNLAIKGIAFQYQSRGKHLVTSSIEHPSVSEVFQSLEKDFGFDITYLPVDSLGRVSVEDLKKAVRDDTVLVSIMHVNNEIGSIQPIKEIGEWLKTKRKIFFHVDDVQGYGRVSLNIKDCGIDLYSVSGHKLHGPKGMGILYIRDGVIISPLFHGGDQQNGYRPGTENVPGIVGLAKAIRMAKEKEEDHRIHLNELKKKLIHGLHDIIGKIRINSNEEPSLGAPHIVNFSLPGLKSEVILHALEEKGIYISTKSACSSKVNKPSRVLKAMGLQDEEAISSLRISFSTENTLEEVDYFLQTIKEILPYYQKIMKV